jgi:hypothetical protein
VFRRILNRSTNVTVVGLLNALQADLEDFLWSTVNATEVQILLSNSTLVLSSSTAANFSAIIPNSVNVTQTNWRVQLYEALTTTDEPNGTLIRSRLEALRNNSVSLSTRLPSFTELWGRVTANGSLSNTTSNGLTLSSVLVPNGSVPTSSPTPTPRPTFRPSTSVPNATTKPGTPQQSGRGGGSKCDTGCIVGIVVGSLAFLLLVAGCIYCIYRMKRNPGRPCRGRSGTLEERCAQLNLSEEAKNFAMATTAKLRKGDYKSFSELIMELATAIHAKPESFTASPIPPPANPDEPLLRYASIVVKRYTKPQASNSPIAIVGAAGRQARNGSETLSLSYYLSMDEELQEAATPYLPTDLSQCSENEILAFIYALCQFDTPQRKERACYLHFSPGEAQLFKDYLNRERALDRIKESQVTFLSFREAYRWSKGVPHDTLKGRLFDHDNSTLHIDKLMQNITTSPDCNERTFTADYATMMEKAEKRAVDFLFFLPLFALFIAMSVIGFGFEDGFYSQRAIAVRAEEYRFPFLDFDFPSNCGGGSECQFWQYLFKQFSDSVNEVDFWNWLRGPLIQGIWQRRGNLSATNLIDAVNVPIGALKVRQVRVSGEPQTTTYEALVTKKGPSPAQQELLQSWFPKYAAEPSLSIRYPPWQQGTEEFASYSLGLLELNETMSGISKEVQLAFRHRSGDDLNGSEWLWGSLGTYYPPSGYAIVLPFNLTQTQVLQMTNQVRNNNWVDGQTRALIAEVFMFNKNIQTITRVRWCMEIPTSGIYRPQVETTVFTLYRRQGFNVAYYIFFALYFAWLFFPWKGYMGFVWAALWEFFWAVPRRIMRARGQTGFGPHVRLILSASLASPFTLTKALNAVFFITVWVYRLWWMHLEFGTIKEVLYQIDHFPGFLEAAAQRSRILTYIQAVSVGLMFTQFLIYVGLLPQLGVINRTLSRSGYSLYGIGLLFLLGLLTFSLTGHVVYGNNIVGYSNMWFALGTTALTVLGNYDYEALKEVTRGFTPFYYTLFMTFLVLLLMSMIVSVLMDNFGEVMEERFDSEPVKRLMHNDPLVTFGPPDFSDRIASFPAWNQVKTYSALLFVWVKAKIQSFQAKKPPEEQFVDPDWSHEEARKAIWRKNHQEFWRKLSSSIDDLQRGSAIQAFFATAHFANLMLPMASKGFEKVPRIPTGQTPQKLHFVDAKSLRTTLEQDYFKANTDMILLMFQEFPSLHLKVPSSVSLLHLMEHFEDWKRRVSRFSTSDAQDEVLGMAKDSLRKLQEYNERLRKELTMNEKAAKGEEKKKVIVEERRTSSGGKGKQTRTGSGSVPKSMEPFDTTASPVTNSNSWKNVIRTLQDQPEGTAVDSLKPRSIKAHVNTFFVTPMSPTNSNQLLQKCEAIVDYLVERNLLMVGSKDVPLDLFIEVWNDLEIGKYTNSKRGNEWSSEVADFYDVSFTRRGLRWITIPTVEDLCELGVSSWMDRLRRSMSLGWGTKQVRAFVVAKNSKKTDGKKALQIFEESFQVAAGTPLSTYPSLHKNMQDLLDDKDWGPGVEEYFDLLEAYCTKSPLTHSQTPFIHHLCDDLTEKGESVYSVIFYLCFLALFIYYLVSMRPLGEGAYLTYDMQQMFYKENVVWPDVNSVALSYAQVTTTSQYYAWLEQVFIPKVYSQEDGTGIGALEDKATFVVGAVKFRQLRAVREDCSKEMSVYQRTLSLFRTSTSADAQWYQDRSSALLFPRCNRIPFGDGDRATYQPIPDSVQSGWNSTWYPSDRVAQAFRHQSCTQLKGAGSHSTDWSDFGCDGHALILPVNLTRTQALQDTAYLKAQNWIDDRSYFLATEMVVYNFNSNAFARVGFLLQIHQGGIATTGLDVIVFRLFLANEFNGWYYLFLALYLFAILLLIKLYIGDLAGTFQRFRNSGASKLSSLGRVMKKDAWWVTNGINIVFFLAAWGFRIWYMALGTADAKIFDVDHYPEDLEAIADASRKLEILDACNVLMCAVKLLYFFKMAPDLNILTKTFVLGATRILSLLFIFGCALICMGLIAFLLYGNYIREFSTMDFCFSTLLRNLLGDDVPYSDMTALKPIYTGVYYTIFLIVCNFTLFNLIIAVLGVAFQDAQAERYDLRIFHAIFRYDTGTTRYFHSSTGFVKKVYVQVFAELRLYLHMFIYYVTFQFTDRFIRRNRKHRFNKNPRYLWYAIQQILVSPNPRRKWRQFLEGFGPEASLTTVNVAQVDRSTGNMGESFADPDTDDLLSPCAKGPGPLRGPGRSETSIPSPESNSANAEQTADVSALRRLVAFDIEQSHKECPIRVRRLGELFVDEVLELGSVNPADTQALIVTAADILGFPRVLLLEWLLQSIHDYKRRASQYSATGLNRGEALFRLMSYASIAANNQKRIAEKALRVKEK